jgi:hypothetical protein
MSTSKTENKDKPQQPPQEKHKVTWLRFVPTRPPKRCIHCLALVHTEPQEGESLPCCGN